MKKHFILSLLSFCLLTGAHAQVRVDAAINGSNSQIFGTLAVGKQFNNGLGIRVISSFGNFSSRSESRAWGDDKTIKTPYNEEYYDPLPGNYGSEVIGYKSTNQGAGLGLGIGYTWQINDRHALWAEAQGQIYMIEDRYVRRTASNMPPHSEYERTRHLKHKNASAALNLSHVIGINKFFSVYYGVSATVYMKDIFQKANYYSSDAIGNGNYVMVGLKPVVHVGVRINLPKQAE